VGFNLLQLLSVKLKMSRLLPMEASLGLSLSPFAVPSIFLELTVILHISYSRLGMSHFSGFFE
jgi:hypothetical protein